MIDDRTLDTILTLGRLDVSSAEKEHFRSQVEDILSYFDLLSKYDTSSVDVDLGEEVGLADLRPDEVRPGFTYSDLDTFAVHFEDHFFTVPRIIEDFLEHKEEE